MKTSQNFNFRKMWEKKLKYKWKYLNHENLYTTKVSDIKPTFWQFIGPGNSFRDQASFYSRLAPMQSPMYSRMDMKNRFFVVPLRKLQPDFEQFATSIPTDNRKMIHTTIEDMFLATYDGISSQHYATHRNTLEEFIGVAPVLDNFYNYFNYLEVNSWQYEPIPQTVAGPTYVMLCKTALGDVDGIADYILARGWKNIEDQQIIDYWNSIKDEIVNLLPFMAYHKIYDDWIIDSRFTPNYLDSLYETIQDDASGYPYISYQDSFTVTFNGVNHTNGILEFLLTTRTANYPKDYFTTCGDGAQAGPLLSIGAQRLDIYGSISQQFNPPDTPIQINPGRATEYSSDNTPDARVKFDNVGHYLEYPDGTTATFQRPDFKVGEVWAEVNDADLITPIKLRYQMAWQRFLERMDSGGNERYNDFVFGMFGIRIPDMYLRRSVLVGSSSTPVHVEEVVAQADGEANEIAANLGDYVGRAYYKGRTRQIRGRVVEHCIFMSISYTTAQQYYWQGMRRDLTRVDNLAFPHPIFQHVGEEQVYNREIYFGDRNSEPFGYQYRYAFDQTALDEIHGEMRGDLMYWHTGRNMVDTPSLGQNFIRQKHEDSDRVFAYADSRSTPIIVYSRHNFFHKMPLSNSVGNGSIG